MSETFAVSSEKRRIYKKKNKKKNEILQYNYSKLKNYNNKKKTFNIVILYLPQFI